MMQCWSSLTSRCSLSARPERQQNMADNQQTACDSLFDISGRVYLVAGAGGGLGGPIACELARWGAKLVLFDTCSEALARIGGSIDGAVCETADMGDAASVERLATLARDRFGRLDGAINAAGKLPISPALEFDEAVFRDCIEVNIVSAFTFSRTIAKALGDDGGRILHIASVSSFVANPNYAAYASSKAGLAQMVKVLAREWAPRNILVNAIGPALTDTGLTHDYLADAGFRKNAISAIPMGRLGEPQDLFGAVLLLLSDGGRFITGQTIYADGGRTLV
jgi:NAD(P)-dependent dehydrogenase (short-subunit alcohol dehydrogenase family)